MSLRTLFIMITLLSLWLGTLVNRARHEKTALEEFRKVGAFIRFRHQRPSKMFDDWDEQAEPFTPKFLRELIGNEFFVQLGFVGFLDSKVTEHQLELLSKLDGVEVLTLQGQDHIGDSELVHIKDLRSLKNLCLWDTNVTDDGLWSLENLRSLRGLGLNRTRISDEGIAVLVNFKRLELLELEGTEITDASLETLKQMNSLSSLDLDKTKLTQDGVNRLKAALPNCSIYFQSSADE